MAKKRKCVAVGTARAAPVTVKGRKEIANQIRKERERFRHVYAEVRGKVVDVITFPRRVRVKRATVWLSSRSETLARQSNRDGPPS
jgi:hypothetical protein